ncbi:Xaa-Pro aminopeptidase [Desulfosporosinus acidiphilus SJ4]|uniref:Xaa-Pro aminopeptidase n=1 Tax=Desulfosporosinus acidiphilus (strain DSM 22704 / JCM 16185 / SJ4) TaxID=646529 RepID=I4D506_DESAJ|nr:Xaa-Pro peptidase family protein [Desulfosporosinus acidiphilus]AFM40880.1 Xaa-Pro aminopeptidase [Desulfosporosinus acidiphilus SJ4]
MNKQRINDVIDKMKKEGLTQIIVSSTASLYYLTGYWVEPHERMIALYLDASGKAVLFGNEIFGLNSMPDLPLICHTDSENPVKDLANVVKAGKLGIDKFWSSKFLIELMGLRNDVVPVHGSAPVDLARMFKDEPEMIMMRHNSRINDQVVGTVISMLEDGVTENYLASQVNKLFLQNGADCEGTQIVCFGANGADPHHSSDSTVLQTGDSVILDIFTPLNHYWCDMTRTVFYKTVSEQQRRVYDLVKLANETAISRIKPGVLLSEIDKTARDIIIQGGYGKYFTHRLGHGIGLECHEPPDVSLASDIPLEAGMIFSVEPGIYLPGEFGVRIEDLVMVMEDGCEVLNKYPKELQVIL